jgi:general secretion pathway protein M
MAADRKSPLQHFMDFWQGRSDRERLVLSAGGGVLLLGLLYGAIYVPIEASRRGLIDRLPQMRAEYRLLTAQVEEIERIRGRSVKQSGGGVSLHRRIESSAMSRGLGDAIISVTPAGNDLIQVVTGDRSARVWMEWLLELERQGIRAHSARIRFSGKDGQARLEATFAGAPS